MAYDCTGGCPRVLHFSNPTVSYSGATTGSAGAARQRALDQQRRLDHRQLAPGGGRRHAADHHARSRTSPSTKTRPRSPIGFTVGDAETERLVARRHGQFVEHDAGAEHQRRARTSADRAPAARWSSRPTANRFGSATITVTVSDGAQTATRTLHAHGDGGERRPVGHPVAGRRPRSPTACRRIRPSPSPTSTRPAARSTLTTSSSNTTVLPNANVRRGRHGHDGHQPHLRRHDDAGGRTGRLGGGDAHRV